jgi:AraC-like DNA-binding protein
MSESTMRRALREEGTSYQRIVDAVRVHRLKQLKREGKLTSGKAIAGDLGFAGKNSFFKFVKTKVGQTYTEFRKAA